MNVATKTSRENKRDTNIKRLKDKGKERRGRATHKHRGNHTPFGPAVAGLAVTTAVHARDTMSA